MTKPIDPKLAKFIAESKVKNRVYHGTDADIREFKSGNRNRIVKGIYFAENPETANIFAGKGTGANVMPAHLAFKNPATQQDMERILDAVPFEQKRTSAQRTALLKKAGHDSAIINTGAEGTSGNNYYIAFHPTQIKSAIGNRGTYDPNDPDITKAKGGIVNKAKFLESSKVKDRLYHGTNKNIRKFSHKLIGTQSGNRGFFGRGYYLSGDPEVANSYADTTGGNVMPLHVNLENPLVIEDKLSHKAAHALNHALETDAFKHGMQKEHVRSGLSMTMVDNPDVADMMTDRLLSRGYDGVVYGNNREVVAFHPHQIKSAIGNRGTYDTTKDDITMAKGGEVSVTAVKKRKDDKIPELELAAKALLAGVISRAEYDKTVKKLKPVTKYESVPRPATDEEALGALKVTQKPHWRGTDVFPEGHPVGLRLDIPAYSDHGVWVNSVHDESGAKTPVKYAPVSAVRNAEFDPGPSKAQRVATGETNKSPFARIKGEWQPMKDEEAVAHMQKHLSHPDYVQVGYDPRRRDYFYHRGDTRKPITHAEHVVQIGPLVLAKNPVYGKRKDFGLKDGGPIHFAIGGQGPKNWIKGGVEQVTNPLKLNITTDRTAQYTPEQVERLQSTGRLARNDAINQWIDRNLTNYIKKQMATHDDPIRKLAEQGIVHMPPEQMGYGSSQAEAVRKKMGAPRLGQSPEAQAWEDAADVAMHPMPIKDLHRDYREPWMVDADPQTKIFTNTDNMHAHYLGFDHLVDILKQDLAEGRLRPEQLSKVSIEHAVRRAHEYDQERKKAMAQTALKATEGMPVHKEYPEGYKWIELAPEDGDKFEESIRHLESNPKEWQKAIEEFRVNRDKKLAEALKYEGDTMGHCVGGYTPDVASGKSRIFSLRDAKNEPHVTIEVEPVEKHLIGYGMKGAEEFPKDFRYEKGNIAPEQHQQIYQRAKQLFNPRSVKDVGSHRMDVFQQAADEVLGKPAPAIRQIKGKGNAKPKKDYIPYVQDFVKSGNWSDVGDLLNADLYHVHPESDVAKKMLSAGQQPPTYITNQELTDITKKYNKAHGGRVTHAHHLDIEERPL